MKPMSPERVSVMRSRQIFVTVAAVCCGVGTLYGTGVLGKPVEKSGGGSLAADATLIAPATSAFSIWSLIYLGLFAYTVRQWLPRCADTARHRVTAGLAAISMLLNAAWLLVVQAGWLEVSVAVILALLVTCWLMVRRLRDRPESGLGERIIVDGTFGLYLGWVCVATFANIAALLVARGAPATGAVAVTITVVGLLIILVLATQLAGSLRGNWFVTGGIAWGLAWVAVGRLVGEPRSVVVGIVAILVVAAVLAATWRAGQLPSRRRRPVTSTEPSAE